MNQTEKEQTAKALTVAFEIMGQTMSDDAMSLFISRLSRFDYAGVSKAIARCVDECKYKITIAEIIERIDDGRPSADEAWQEVYMLSEWDSKVMTEEQQMAFSSVSTALQTGGTTDQINCKKAFIDRYNKLVKEARSESRPVKYVMSMGMMPDGRRDAMMEAIAQGKMTQQQGVSLLPEFREEIMDLPLLPEQKATAGMIENMAKGMSMERALTDD